MVSIKEILRFAQNDKFLHYTADQILRLDRRRRQQSGQFQQQERRDREVHEEAGDADHGLVDPEGDRQIEREDAVVEGTPKQKRARAGGRVRWAWQEKDQGQAVAHKQEERERQ